MGLLDDAIREHLELKRKHGASSDEIARAEQEALAPARRDPSAGAGVPPIEAVPGQAVAPDPTDLEPPPPPAPGEETQAAPPVGAGFTEAAGEPLASDDAIEPAPLPVDEPLYADEYGAEPAPADYDEYAAGPAPADYDAPLAPQPPPYEDEEDDDLAPPPVHVGPAAHPPLESTEPIEPDDLDLDPEEQSPPREDLDPGEPAAGETLDPRPDDPYRARTSILDEPLGAQPPAPPQEEPPPSSEQDVLEETPDFLQETPEHDKLWFEQKPPRDFDFE